MAECPTCGRDDFSAEKYMKMHHKQTHGESIAGFEYTCDWCGETGRKKTIEPGDEHQFCDTECYHKWRAETLVGENSPVWEGGKITVTCDWCGSTIEKVRAQHENHEGDFCSKRCHGDWLSENLTGENHPRWKGGDNQIHYGRGWPKKRRQRLEYDGNQCVVCGLTDEEHKRDYGRGLNVHHLRPVREYVEDGRVVEPEKAHQLDNLVTMCIECHRKWEGFNLRPDTTL